MNPAAGLALYRQGELLRLQGEFGAAEEALPRSQPVRLGAAAGPRPASACPGASGRGSGGDR